MVHLGTHIILLVSLRKEGRANNLFPHISNSTQLRAFFAGIVANISSLLC